MKIIILALCVVGSYAELSTLPATVPLQNSTLMSSNQTIPLNSSTPLPLNIPTLESGVVQQAPAPIEQEVNLPPFLENSGELPSQIPSEALEQSTGQVARDKRTVSFHLGVGAYRYPYYRRYYPYYYRALGYPYHYPYYYI